MAHLLILVDGLKEGLEDFEKEWRSGSLGKGIIKLREVKLYDIQYDKRQEKKVLAEFHPNEKMAERVKRDKFCLKFHNKNKNNFNRTFHKRTSLCL